MRYLILLIVVSCITACRGQEVSQSVQKPSPTKETVARSAAEAVSDGQKEEEEEEEEAKPHGNTPPIVKSARFVDQTEAGTKKLVLEVEAEDAEEDLISFKCRWMINDTTLIERDGLEFDAKLVKKGDRLRVSITPADVHNEGVAYVSGEFKVPNSAPVFVSVPDTQLRGEDYAYAAKAEDADGDIIVYGLDAAPSGMTMDSQSGVVRWPVGNRQGGTHRVRVSARDADGASSVQEFTLNVAIEGGEQ